jgi:hypothetical protein
VLELKRAAALAACLLALGAIGSSNSPGANAPFLVVDGDGWLTSNATYGDGAWAPISPSRTVFGLQLSERNDLPFDKGTAGATFWVRNANCGAHFAGYGEPCGWQLGLAVTQFRSVVVGGDGVEIDGLTAKPPYGRIVNSSNEGARLIGLLTNAYVDFSGVDEGSAPSWFSGFDLGRDAFSVERAANGTRHFDDMFDVDRSGNASVAGTIAASRSLQHTASQWATRAKLAHGTYTFRFTVPFQAPPVCVATTEGAPHIRVAPTASECTVTSEQANDTSTIDLVVIGNPQ